jgi:hypothetical protein
VWVLLECLHYFHDEYIDTWLHGGSTNCPVVNTNQLVTSLSLPNIKVRTVSA